MGEIFPVGWIRPEALPWVLSFLEDMPVLPKYRKRALEEWAAWAGVKLTAAMVERVTGLKAGEI